MNLVRILNCISYTGVLLAYMFTGWVTFVIARCFKAIFAYEFPGKPLPNLTECVLAYGNPGTSIIVNLVLGFIFAALLFFLEFGSEKRKKFLPFCLTIAFTLLFLQVSAFLEGVSMPYFYVMLGMTDAKH